MIEPVAVTPVPVAGGAGTRSRAGYRYARLGDRLIALVLDTFFLFGVFAVVDAWAFMRWGLVEGRELQLTAASLLIALVLNAIVLLFYGWLLEAACGATFGKAVVGIKVVGTARPRSFSACGVRNVLRIVDGIGFYLVGTLVAACSSARQRLGDIYARTSVIEESFGNGIRIAAFALWVVSLAAAGWAVPRICSVNQFVSPPYLSQVVIYIGGSENSAYVRAGGLTVRVHLASRDR